MGNEKLSSHYSPLDCWKKPTNNSSSGDILENVRNLEQTRSSLPVFLLYYSLYNVSAQEDKLEELLALYVFLTPWFLQDDPVQGKTTRRNSFLLYGSLQDVPVPGKIRMRNSVLSLCLPYSMVPCRMFLCQGR